MKYPVVFFILPVFFMGCSTTNPLPLPSNITTVPFQVGSKEIQLIDTLNDSFVPSSSTTFDKLNLCAVEIFKNQNVTLKDSVGSFIGASTGNYYQKSNIQNIPAQGKSLYSSKESQVILVTGNFKPKSSDLGLIQYIAQYDVKIELKHNLVKLKYSNILRAQENTGGLDNNGFQPLGTWNGRAAPMIVNGINDLTVKYKLCVLTD